MPNTPLGFPFPDTGSPANVSGDIQALAEAVDDQFQLGLQGVELFTFTANDTWDPDTDPSSPDWKYIIVYAKGGGGGGAGAGTTAAGQASAGGGGAEGELALRYASRDSIISPLTIVVGLGGGGGSGNSAGSAGGNSTVNGTGFSITATGGGGGSSSLSTSGIGHGAGGDAAGTANDIGRIGADGGGSIVQNGMIMSIGHGAPGVRPLTSASGAGGNFASSSQIGFGGSGAYNYPSQGTNRTGGGGGNGRVWIVVVY